MTSRTILASAPPSTARSVSWLIDCSDGPTNKFPFIHRQLKEELVQRESDELSFNLYKFGKSVEPWNDIPLLANLDHIVQAVHWIKDRVGLSTIGAPNLIQVLSEIVSTKDSGSIPDALCIITDQLPTEPLGDVLNFLKDNKMFTPISIVYIYHIQGSLNASNFYRNLATHSGGNLVEVEITCDGELVSAKTTTNTSYYVPQQVPEVKYEPVRYETTSYNPYTTHRCERSAPVSVREVRELTAPVTTVREVIPTLQPCMYDTNTYHRCSTEVPLTRTVTTTAPVQVPVSAPVQLVTPVTWPRSDLVLARRGDSSGYFYLGKTLESSGAHQKIVELLELTPPEIYKVSDYDIIPIAEAMSYSIFSGSRVLGKVDTQRFCPGTVLHGSLNNATQLHDRESAESLIVEYLDGEVRSTSASRIVRIPESLFYWLQKYFPSPTEVIRDVDARIMQRPRTNEPDQKLSRFFDDEHGEQQTNWYKYKYSNLPNYNFEKDKYQQNQNLVRWYRDRYRRPIFFDSDSEEDEPMHYTLVQRKKKPSATLRLKKTWFDRYLDIRDKQSEREWYKKLLQRENEIIRRRVKKNPVILSEPPVPWRHWLPKGQEPEATRQRPRTLTSSHEENTKHRNTGDFRSTSRIGMQFLSTNKSDSVFNRTASVADKERLTVRKLMIQTDPHDPPTARNPSEHIYTKRW